MMDNMIEVRDLQVTLSGKTIVQHNHRAQRLREKHHA